MTTEVFINDYYLFIDSVPNPRPSILRKSSSSGSGILAPHVPQNLNFPFTSALH